MHIVFRLFFLVSLLLLVFVDVSYAQSDRVNSFSILNLDASARASALGGSFGALYGDDLNTLFYNPALLNADMHGLLSASYLNHLSDLKAGSIGYARHHNRIGTWAVGMRYLGYGSFERADANGVRDGSTFGAGDAVLTLGLARSYDSKIRYGVNLHALFARIDDQRARAIAADAGIILHIPERTWTLGAAVRNLGTVTESFGATNDELPLDVQISFSKQLSYLPLLISLTAYELNRFGSSDGLLEHMLLGGELRFSDGFQVRLGYNHRRHEQLKTDSRLDLAGFSIGFGIKVTRLRFDYAFNSWSALGSLHQLSVGTKIH